MDDEEVHRLKALECLAGAASELAAGRFNNAANRAYYACFHAAIVALLRGGVRREFWGHDDVRAQFAGELIGRRKLYETDLRDSLDRLGDLRQLADYRLGSVSSAQATRAVRRANRFSERVLENADKN